MTDARRDILSVTPFLLTLYRSLVEIGTNYAGAESERYMACGVLNFDMSTAGRRAVDLMVTDVQRNFNGTRWTQNGPDVLDRVLHVMCGTEHVSMGSLTGCYIYIYRVRNKSVNTPLSHERLVVCTWLAVCSGWG
jgi:hypothetical protein